MEEQQAPEKKTGSLPSSQNLNTIPPVMRNVRSASKRQKAFWYWLAALILVLAIAGVFLFWFFKPFSKPSSPGKSEIITTTRTDTKGNTFSSSPLTAFPSELKPDGGQGAQYWQNAQFFGAIFAVKKPMAQAVQDYINQLKGAGWILINSNVGDSSASFIAADPKTGLQISVQAAALPGDLSSLNISAKK